MGRSPCWLGLGLVLVASCAQPAPPAVPKPPPPLPDSAGEPPPALPAAEASSLSQPTRSELKLPATRKSTSPDEALICRGTPPLSAVPAISGRAAEGRKCYEELLRRAPKAEGYLLIELIISESGEMHPVSAVEDSIQDSELTECVMSLFEAVAVPPPDGGCARVRVPMRFVPKNDPPAAPTP